MINPDSQAILLLCSHLCISSNSQFSPFTLREWNSFVKSLQAASMRPADLLNLPMDVIKQNMGLSEENSDRISNLLQRSGSIAIELERLASLGINILTRAEKDYPIRFRQRLKESAPALLFYAGEKALLGQPGIAVVGSRNLDTSGQSCAEFVGNACGLSGLVLYTGGAKGVDTLSMNAALSARGTAAGILASGLEKTIRIPEYREAMKRGDLCLATPYSPSAPFSAGNAMGRNRLIYTLADYAIIVASDYGKGGTWSGANEALRAKWLPVFVLEHPDMPEGNKYLLQKGALPFPHPIQEDARQLENWLSEHAIQNQPEPQQPSLF